LRRNKGVSLPRSMVSKKGDLRRLERRDRERYKGVQTAGEGMRGSLAKKGERQGGAGGGRRGRGPTKLYKKPRTSGKGEELKDHSRKRKGPVTENASPRTSTRKDSRP